MALTYICPGCKGQLLSEPEAYRCQECRRHYPIVLRIPDFRLFPDPHIPIEDDYAKGQALAEHYDEMSFPQLLARYWEMTPGVPDDLVCEYVRSALDKHQRSLRTWETIKGVGVRSLTPALRQAHGHPSPSGRGAGGEGRYDELLEIGCGTAGFLAAAGPAFSHAVGIDIAFRWLIIARKRLEELGVKNVTLVCACAEHLPFPDGAFDLVVAEDVLDHTKDQGAFAKESARVLKGQTGVFYMSTPNRYSLGPDPHVWVSWVGFLPPRFRDRYVRWRRGVPYGPIRPVSYGDMRRLLRSASFRKCRVILPQLGGLNPERLSRWQRVQVHLYELARGIPLLSYALRLVGPSLQVLSSPAQSSRAADVLPQKRVNTPHP